MGSQGRSFQWFAQTSVHVSCFIVPTHYSTCAEKNVILFLAALPTLRKERAASEPGRRRRRSKEEEERREASVAGRRAAKNRREREREENHPTKKGERN